MAAALQAHCFGLLSTCWSGLSLHRIPYIWQWGNWALAGLVTALQGDGYDMVLTAGSLPEKRKHTAQTQSVECRSWMSGPAQRHQPLRICVHMRGGLGPSTGQLNEVVVVAYHRWCSIIIIKVTSWCNPLPFFFLGKNRIHCHKCGPDASDIGVRKDYQQAQPGSCASLKLNACKQQAVGMPIIASVAVQIW